MDLTQTPAYKYDHLSADELRSQLFIKTRLAEQKLRQIRTLEMELAVIHTDIGYLKQVVSKL